MTRDETGHQRAIGYIRVSSEDQAHNGVSLDAQRAQIEGFCRGKRWELIGVESDEGLSGKGLERPGLGRARKALEEGSATVLVVTKLDRLSRSVRDIFALIEDEFQGNGASLVSIEESLDATAAMGKFVLTILAGMAQMERELVGERTKGALRHLQSQGHHVGRVPFGWRMGEDGKLVKHEAEQKLLRKARRLRKRGRTLTAISEELGWPLGTTYYRLTKR